MQTKDEKIDNAVHAVFQALGLSVANHEDLAYELNEKFHEMLGGVISDDTDDD